MDNNSEFPLSVSNIQIIFDSEPIVLDKDYIILTRQQKGLVNTYRFRLPYSLYGRQPFTLEYEIRYFDYNQWYYIDRFRTNNRRYFISILPRREIGSSKCTVFLSRSIRPEERYIGDLVARRLRQWNLDTRTVGIEVVSSDVEASTTIRNEIRACDGLIALATPRNFNSLNKTWQTLEWLHDEAGIGFGINKPLMIIKDATVDLGGLPKYLTKFNDYPLIEYSITHPTVLLDGIDYYMPYFREAIKKDRANRFFSGLVQGGIIILAGLKAVDILENAFNGFFSEEEHNK